MYVDESKISALGAFAVRGGNLTELASPSFAARWRMPAGIVVN